MTRKIGVLIYFLAVCVSLKSQVWISDKNNGTYQNPVLYSDYSDPDVIRVGDDFYMTASSFNCVPGLPILHSKDLVNWRIINYALPELRMEGIEPGNIFDQPQHGKGVWAPSIRFHKGEYLIYWGDPDFGIYLVKTKDIRGHWEKPILVLPGKGRIDPCPLFDKDGKQYLIHAWAGSRANLNSILTVCELNADGTKAISNTETLVFDGNDGINHTVEGGKFYKVGDYYYILAPAGGVTNGWQLALRSKNIHGPYEVKTVLHQGKTNINGPHQGGLVETQTGEWWFLHFQDNAPYGRITHLQPVTWKDGWPVIGIDDIDYCGEPVLSHKKPNVGHTYPIQAPVENDEFDSHKLGLQWQWQANPDQAWCFPSANGYLRMYGQYYPEDFTNFWDIPNLLMQKFPAPEFMATMKVTTVLQNEGDKAGIVIMGLDYSYLALVKTSTGYEIERIECENAEQKSSEKELNRIQLSHLKYDVKYNYLKPLEYTTLYFRVDIRGNGVCSFFYSTDGADYQQVGTDFQARQGKWIGAKIGMFIQNKTKATQRSWMDVSWFRINKHI